MPAWTPMTVEQHAATQVARTLQDRLPRAFAVIAVICAVVGVVECWTYPDRLPTFAALYGIGVAALAVGLWRARRRTTPPRRVVAITALAVAVFIANVTAYFVLVRGQIELMALGLVYIVLGAVIVLPWGMVAQSGVVAEAIGGFTVATAFEVPAATPLAVQFVGLLSVAALTIFPAAGIERYHLDLLRRDEGRNALLDIARDLTGEFDTDQVFDRIQQRIALLVDCDSVATYFLDRTAGVFRLTSHYGITSDKLQAVQAIPLPGPSPAISGPGDGGDTTGALERAGNEPVPRPELVARFGMRNLFVAPLFLHNASLGFLVAARRRDRLFQADEIRLSDSIARQLSVAIETEKHQREKQEEAEAGKALARVGRELISALDTPVLLDRLCRVSAEVLHYDVSHALLRDLELETRLKRVDPEVDVAWGVPPDLPPLHTDPSKLRVVVRNVVTNALKFTDSGSVHIAVGVLDGGIAITVSDTRIGVPADMLEEIFEPFRQVDPTPGRAGGVGLGLHLVRRMLDMLGGRVEVESEVRKGLTFRIWRPLRQGPNEVLHEAS